MSVGCKAAILLRISTGSASIGQVHAARLADEFSNDLRAVRPKHLMREFKRTPLRELDYERERKNLEEFARNFEDQPEVHFPYAVPEISTTRVLAMEKLIGVGFQQLGEPGFEELDRGSLAKRALEGPK